MSWRLAARVIGAPLRPRASTPIAPRDLIVVLGAALGPRNSLTPPLLERVTVAAELFAAAAAPRVVATGGVTTGTRSEAAVIADALEAAGVPREAIVVEDRSRTTAENARYTHELVGDRSAWLVTQPFHARRAERLFRAEGFIAD
ncbi:MAG TPA: YdcF family protein, partial [Kofleriaceae bacterium]